MPTRRIATATDLQDFAKAGKLNVKLDGLVIGKLEIESSLFSDPGEDYQKLFNNGQEIGYWPGY